MAGAATKTVLALSLGLNVLAVGLVGGAAIAWLRVETTPPHPLRDAGRRLDPFDRRRYDAMLKTFSQSAQPLRHEAQNDRKAAAQLFIAPNFDVAAVNAELAHARDADLKLRFQLEARLVSFAATLSEEERAKLSAGFVRAGPLHQPLLRRKR